MNQSLKNSPTTGQTMAMKGGGYYSQRTRGAKDVIDNAVKMLFDAAQVIPEPSKGQPIRLADFGAADGGTSEAAWRQCIEHLQSRFTQTQIQVTYTDLPSNDFSALFKNLLGFGSSGANTFLTDIKNVFVNACGIGFHEQLLPDETLDIGFSATAMHYISEKPCTIDDHVHMVGASGDALAAFGQQAKRNWEDLLLARSRELRPGGRLVILNFGIDEQGRYLGNTGGINMFDTFAELWSNMRNEGIITSDEFKNTAFPQYYRTVEEFCAPLKDQSSAVYQAGLRLVSAKTGVLGCPYRRAFDEAQGSMSNREFAVSYIPTLRSWSEAVFVNGLSGERPQEEKDRIVDQFYQRYEDRVAENPDGHAMDYVHCYLAMEKVL